MLSPVKISALSCLAMVIGCASGPSGQTFDSPIGEWSEKYETTNGATRSTRLNIIDETGGTYSKGLLKIYMAGDDRTWKGYWIHETGGMSCSEKKDGSLHWGEQVFHFNESYTRYTGTWDMCGEGPKYAVRGYR